MTIGNSAAESAASDFCEQLYATPHDSLPKLCLKMNDTTKALSSVGLESVLPFAQAYGELTLRAERALEAGVFTDVPTTERLACNFAGLYFDALAAHLTGNRDDVPMAWQQLFDTERIQPPWLQLALGVNAHIGNDLPLALQATAVPSDYGDNFFGLNRAIKNIAPELAPAFLPTIPHTLRLGIARVSANVIVKWRQRAWRDFMQLETGATSPSEIESSAARRGRRLQRASVALGAAGLTGSMK